MEPIEIAVSKVDNSSSKDIVSKLSDEYDNQFDEQHTSSDVTSLNSSQIGSFSSTSDHSVDSVSP
jgi:capsular polysaccharide biosynthesis protein